MARPAKVTDERELKLGIPPDFRLPELQGERLDPRTFTSIYYDTADYRLAGAGITLRRRVQGKDGVWQLKLPSKNERRELEFPGGSTVPHDIQRLLLAHVRGRDLVSIAQLRTRRVGMRVTEGAEDLADVVVDSVSVLGGARVVRRFSELEIELINGDENVLSRLEATLREAGACDGDPRPKVFKALALELPVSSDSISAASPSIEHLKHMLWQQCRIMLAHDPGTRLGADPEDLHEMRVAVRRMRGFLRSARAMLQSEWVEGLRAELKWLGSILGPVRDLDVQMERFRSEFSTLTLPERRALSHLIKLLEPERTKVRNAMLEAMQSPRYFKLLDDLDVATRTPRVVDPAVPLKKIAAKEFKKLRRSVKALGANPSDAALHRVRIKTKRARYAAELAGAAVGKSAVSFARRSKAVQDVLGRHQDGVVIEDRLRKLLNQTQSPVAALTVGRLIERQAARRRAARQTWKDEWKKLKTYGQRAWA